MSSNNPFASAMNGEYKHHRDPPPPPPPGAPSRQKQEPSKKVSAAPPPPSYDEVARPGTLKTEYPIEKPPQKSSSSRPHRSHSDSTRQKERRLRRKLSKEASKKKSVAPHNPKNLDTIDKLDVSAFFGGRFHHDGPFDACTPHRNQNVKAAPVKAFPADGPNTSMKATPANSDNVNLAFGNYEDHNMIVGRSAREIPSQPRPLGSINPTEVPRMNPSVVAFDANEKSTPVHGYSTAGLGSTTFVDGAPAPRGDEFLAPPSTAAGLGRKKSLVSRLRKNSGSENSLRRNSNDNSGEYHRSSFGDEDGNSSSLLRRVKSLKVGRK